ncbi:MAG: pentapeptide repeat-containing protein [Microcoleus vaginatus WJT46-NPBG5]|jgi:predicted NACHT family NTPase/uncharacterized protein YjbI with pentapeptide repeats|nr:pentapeptide repeat-containing protein [Microcoleus vaginatus WJT46-NPBG5]
MTSIELAPLLAKIVTLVATPVKTKLERNDRVIKLLKDCGLEQDHPPADFSGVYAYTLVEYGIGKPRPVLELFRQDEIRQAFREAFEQNDLSILVKKGEDFIDAYALGDEIKKIGIEPLAEFVLFATHFRDVTEKTRTPAEVVRDRKLDNLQDQVTRLTSPMEILLKLDNLQDQLARLTSPIEILLTFAQQTQNYQSLQLVNNASASKVRKFILAQQMRSWFTALKYNIESYEVEEETYFELIINIPIRRGYERILVRGVEGEAKLADVLSLRKAVDTQKTKEGWLVAARRISPAASTAAKKEENQDVIFCYTFDELLDQDADFNKYLDWLEAEVKQREIDKMYVPLACTKDEFDPITQEKIGTSNYNCDDGGIESYIDRWLDDPSKEHISILGEFGTGKTWLTLHYAWTALQKYRAAKEQGIERPRIPLVIPLRDYAKAVSAESLFSEFFFHKHEIPLPGYSAFEQLNRMGKLLLIFDGFDEMAERVDSQKMINNFWELARVVVPGSKAILTCRTEHFPEAKEGRALLNAELKASISALTGEPPQFEVVELEKFSDDQIRQVLSFKTTESTVEKIMGNPQLLDLARRPVMTELILAALPEIEAGKPIDMSRIYLYAVKEKMKRDIKAERTFTSLADKLYFLCELSWEMLSTDQMSLNYRVFPERLRRLFGEVVQEQKNLDHWHYDMMGQTMLIRNADGDYRPAHRSLLEFFVAYKFAAELGILAPDFIDIAREQSHVDRDIRSTYSWSTYFRRHCDSSGNLSLIPTLEEFIPEQLSILAETVGKEAFMGTGSPGSGIKLRRSAILELMLNMISSDTTKVSERLISLIKQTCEKSSTDIGATGGNIASILVRYQPEALKNQDLTDVDLRSANFGEADLTNCILDYADLRNSVFHESVELLNASMRYANFKGAILGRYVNIKTVRITISENIEIQLYHPNLHHIYNDDPKFNMLRMLRSEFQDDEIIVALFVDGNFRWKEKIKSYSLLRCNADDQIVQLLTIEGKFISLDTNTGLPLESQNLLCNWKNVDLMGAEGIDEPYMYILSVLGAVNLPNISYEPSLFEYFG